MTEILDVNAPHIYSKIDFLAEQCRLFAARRETRLASCFANQAPIFATDIQVVLVNWPIKQRRGTIPLLHMATVHQGSQFVVAATTDFDPGVSMEDIEDEMLASGDFELPRSMRSQARVWSASEYLRMVMKINRSIRSEDDLLVGGSWHLPGEGARVRTDILMYAHMMLVKKLLGRDYRRAFFCLDAESGLAAATSALFVDEVAMGRVDIAEVLFTKGQTNDRRSELSREGRAIREILQQEHRDEVLRVMARRPTFSELEALTSVLLERRFADQPQEERGKILKAEGFNWPFHTKAEPEKRIRFRTDLGQHDVDDLAGLLARSSLHPVDTYFNLARRRLTGFERGIPTSANAERIWHAYAYYRPDLVPKVAMILRFYYNYMLADRRGQTPAMKLGLAKGKVYVRDLLAFR
ncbi:hypothetical protein [Donghicola mangrovi]|uniref:Uncharacterized protein n=1 Tax=Donghicola mangrovi TaxID=2729614 RepID=A0A850Q9S5_9RHOB|nr:hypothetical protein [Donghicola mangrovi]NVO24992.1 hypothetical protein [Donghicola mangrovi]